MTDVQTRTDADTDPQREKPDRPGVVPTRRAVLTGAGALGATCVLAACGTDTSTGSSSNNPIGSDFTNDPAPAGSKGALATGAQGGSDSGGGSKSGGGGVKLVAASDVPSGGGIIKGDLVITQPQKGTYKAFSKVCTHQGCAVNKVDGGVISCPCHGSTFSIEDGSPTAGPAKTPLAETQVKVDGDNIVKA